MKRGAYQKSYRGMKIPWGLLELEIIIRSSLIITNHLFKAINLNDLNWEIAR